MIGYLIPTTPYLQALNRILLMGAELRHIISEILNILLLTIIYFLLAVFILKRKLHSEEVSA